MADTVPQLPGGTNPEVAAPLEPQDDEDYFDSEEEWSAPAPAAPGAAAATNPKIKDFDYAAAGEVEQELAGAKVRVVFKLPSGEAVERDYHMGHTVELLKVHLEELHGLPYPRTVLTLAGDVLIDPLSLNDYPAIKPDAPNVIDVQLRE